MCRCGFLGVVIREYEVDNRSDKRITCALYERSRNPCDAPTATTVNPCLIPLPVQYYEMYILVARMRVTPQRLNWILALCV